MPPRFLVAGGGTGGHLYPALNLADALRERAPDVEVSYVGAERGLEADVLPERDLPYTLLPSLPIYRSRPWRNLRWLVRAPGVVDGLRRLFRDLDPEVVVGTGGYAAGPPLLWARLTGRATALQEQNAAPGMVTRVMAPWVDQLHLGFPEAEDRVRAGRSTRVFTFGNPVRVRPRGGADGPTGGAPGPEAGRESSADELHPAFRGRGRIVLVAGGSQGARGLNRRWLEDLRRVEAWPADLRVVWIAGRRHADSLQEEVAELTFGHHVRVLGFVPELAAQLHRVDLAVSRAGAMFLSELAVAGAPAVLVPFPAASGGHQGANARCFAREGAAVVREEESLGPGDLWRLVATITSDRERRTRMARAARSRGRPDAAARIAGSLLELADGRAARGEDGDAGG